MTGLADLIVVGSGPSGAQTAKAAAARGLSVLMLDVGFDEKRFEDVIPKGAFHDLHANDPEQHRYFLGPAFSGISRARPMVVAQLTPPRQFITRDVEKFLPIESSSFFPVQSLALGGLGAGWGAGTHTYEPFELAEAGLSAVEMRGFYQEVADDIGISGEKDEHGGMVLEIENIQKPLEIDSNARAILRAYLAKKTYFNKRGFFLGRSPAAVLTERSKGGEVPRGPHSYRDMDFYSDDGRAVYRPKYSVAELASNPRFRYLGESVVVSFEETRTGTVRVFCADISSRRHFTVEGRRLALAAGALNSARIVLRSLGKYETHIPLLCNPYHYVPCINLAMLGRPADDRRHSLAQLTGVFTSPGRYPDRVVGAFYSYRSLLLFRLVKEMPLPTWLGLQAARFMMTSFTIVGVHHSDRPSSLKWLELRKTDGESDRLAANFELTPEERQDVRKNIRALAARLIGLGCMPLGVTRTAFGSSIHYAGTIPMSDDPRVPLASDTRGRLNGTRTVYLADSSPWRFLPAKGLTFTLMANARRVAHEISLDLRSGSD